MKLAAAIVLLINALAFGALATLSALARMYSAYSYSAYTLAVPVAAAVLAGVNAYFGARLIFSWLRDLATRQADKIARL